MAHYVDSNPRRLKRILNIYTLGRTVLRVVRIFEEGLVEEMIFLKRFMQWVILSEQWPVRMTLILQQLNDDAQMNGGAMEFNSRPQKAQTPENGTNKDEVSRYLTKELVTWPVNSENVVSTVLPRCEPGQQSAFVQLHKEHRAKVEGEGEGGSGKDTQLCDFYHDCVEGIIYSDLGEKHLKDLILVDGDPEVFDALIYFGGDHPENTDEKEITGGRLTIIDAYFLQRFSFNLNPAISSAVTAAYSLLREFDQVTEEFKKPHTRRARST